MIPTPKEIVFSECEIKFDPKYYFSRDDEISLNILRFKNCTIKSNDFEILNGNWKKKLIINELRVN